MLITGGDKDHKSDGEYHFVDTVAERVKGRRSQVQSGNRPNYRLSLSPDKDPEGGKVDRTNSSQQDFFNEFDDDIYDNEISGNFEESGVLDKSNSATENRVKTPQSLNNSKLNHDQSDKDKANAFIKEQCEMYESFTASKDGLVHKHPESILPELVVNESDRSGTPDSYADSCASEQVLPQDLQLPVTGKFVDKRMVKNKRTDLINIPKSRISDYRKLCCTKSSTDKTSVKHKKHRKSKKKSPAISLERTDSLASKDSQNVDETQINQPCEQLQEPSPNR